MSIHVLNRLLVTLFSVLAVVFWAGVIFTIWVYPRQLGSSVRQMGLLLGSADVVVQVMITLLGLAVVLVAFLVLLSEVMPETPAVVRLPQVSGGQAVLSTESLAQLVKYTAEQVPQIVSVRPRVSSLGSQVDVDLEVRTAPLAHVPSQTEDVCRAVRLALEERTGVTIRHLTVHLRSDPLGPAGRPDRKTPDDGRAPGREILIPTSAVPPAAAEVTAPEPGETLSGRAEGPRS
ncbi:MAG: hypothetical protein HY689_08940 [Chloroflexi bacterium]|nr:hypothetical protein [Chloroflexota bacterium]